MSQDRVESDELQVHCLGHSADLGALRRSLEARGVVSRSRLTPVVRAVIADSTVPADHPTLITARDLGIDILNPAEAFDRLVSVSVGPRQWAPPPQVQRSSMIIVAVLVLAAVLVLLGFAGAMAGSEPCEATEHEWPSSVSPR
jgi:hypothetical protein